MPLLNSISPVKPSIALAMSAIRPVLVDDFRYSVIINYKFDKARHSASVNTCGNKLKGFI